MTTTMAKVPVGYRIFSRAVHNDAMKQDPPEIYGWRAIMLAMSVCLITAMLHQSDSVRLDGVPCCLAWIRLSSLALLSSQRF